MICRQCGKECQKGIIETHEFGKIDLLDCTPAVLRWVPEAQKDKLFRKNTKIFEVSGEIGFYCEDCGTLYAEFTNPTYNTF